MRLTTSYEHFRFASMYPHIILAFNIERNTMVAKIIIPEITEDSYDHFFLDEEIVDVSTEDDDDSDEEKEFNIGYDAGKDFLDNYLTDDVLSVGSKWFNLPDIDAVHNDFKNKFKIKPRKRFSIKKAIKYFIEEINI